MMLYQIIYSILSAILAGFVNSIAGGGTLILFFVLLCYDTSAIIANGTTTLALAFGSIFGVLKLHKRLIEFKALLYHTSPIIIAGTFFGSYLVTNYGNEYFRKIVPFLIVISMTIFLFQEKIQRFFLHHQLKNHDASRHTINIDLWDNKTKIIFYSLLFMIAVYGGYFGSHLGIVFLALFGLIGFNNIHTSNSLKIFFGCIINITASIWFIKKNSINWSIIGFLIMGSMLGSYLGILLSLKLSHKNLHFFIKIILIFSVFLFFLVNFLKK